MTVSNVAAARSTTNAGVQIVTMALGALFAGIIMPVATAIGENIADRWIRKPSRQEGPKDQNGAKPEAANDTTTGPAPAGGAASAARQAA